ncbi:hypothetical protein [Crocinitomix algicola]|uniref:hypothetical protein n=1 Tax=Crocinitomix algicola TaxID=1740263 RepID=UPI00087276D6|nr:hypothetical protein [Crocinitomix algicola]
MIRIGVFAFLGLLVFNTGCERCMKCTYSYTETTIVETPDGEEEQTVTYEEKILLDSDGDAFGEECYKRGEFKNGANPFTIENYYELEKSKTELDNFEYDCYEL